MNSPIVRGENLRFREEGVHDVVSRVMLPWVNAFRFFLGQASLLQKTTGIAFKYNPHAPLSNNVVVMDRWILARCQSLILLFRQEMAAYRLYSILPRLLDLVDELTNWYIRFNRRRLKGEDGVEDTIAGLNTLFETLLTLCRTMVSRRCGQSPNLLSADERLVTVVLHAIFDGKPLPDVTGVYTRRPIGPRPSFDPLFELSRSERGIL